MLKTRSNVWSRSTSRASWPVAAVTTQNSLDKISLNSSLRIWVSSISSIFFTIHSRGSGGCLWYRSLSNELGEHFDVLTVRGKFWAKPSGPNPVPWSWAEHQFRGSNRRVAKPSRGQAGRSFFSGLVGAGSALSLGQGRSRHSMGRCVSSSVALPSRFTRQPQE